jgi:hypothetical protein
MLTVYYLEDDPIEAVDSLCIFTQVRTISIYLQLLCNAHHICCSPKEMPYKASSLTGMYSQWVIQGEKNYEYVLLGLLQLLNRYKQFNGKEHACRKLTTSVLRVPDSMADEAYGWTIPPVYINPKRPNLLDPIAREFEVGTKEYIMACHRANYLYRLKGYFEPSKGSIKNIEFWDKIPEWMPFREAPSRDQVVSNNPLIGAPLESPYKRKLSSLGVVSCYLPGFTPAQEEADISKIAEEYEDTEEDD